jgi:hypothetical protein
MKKLWNTAVNLWIRFTTYFINRHKVNAWVYSNWDQYQKMVDMINTAENLDELKKWIYERPVEDAVVLPGSDVGLGIIKGSHWGAALMAHHFNDLLQKADAKNFLEITFQPSAKRMLKGDNRIIVTIQKVEGLTPTEKIKKLEQALGFASSVIKSGEPWTEECEKIITSALNQSGPSFNG